MDNEKKENKGLKVTKIVFNTIFYILIVVLLLFSIANINGRGENKIPSLFGKGFETVQTSSMEGNEKDSFTTNDLIFVKVVNDKNRDKKLANVKVGDIITFVCYDEGNKTFFLNSHRVVDILDNENGEKVYITQGDKVAMNPTYKYDASLGLEGNDSTKFEVVQADEIRGIYTGKWVNAGKSFKFLQTSNGFLVCIVLPVAIFFIVELVILILNLNKLKQEKNNAKHEEDMEKLKKDQEAMLEAEKARIRAEILAEQAAKENTEETKEESEGDTK